MKPEEWDRVYDAVQSLSLHQLCLLWRWITLELGRRIYRR